MPRGFTLLELLITVAVLSIILAFAAPSFQNVFETNKMQRLAEELHGFMIQAKSEAVFRNQDLWAHIDVASDPVDTGEWSIALTDSSVSGGAVILVLSGKPFRDITFDPDYSSQQIKFDGIRGKVKNGSIDFNPIGMTNKKLRIKGSYGAARIVVCGEQGVIYGYPACGG
ncbi:GspH/FimT family pseudopilin [Vibrio chemaguriensis]